MITPVLLSLLALAQTPALHWPMVPNAIFSISGIDSSGTAVLEHAAIFEKTDPSKYGKTIVGKTGTWASLTLAPGTTPWKTLQIAFMTTQDGTLVKFGGIAVTVKGDSLQFEKEGKVLKVAGLSANGLNDVQLLKHFDSVLAYVNGAKAIQSVLATKGQWPVEVGADRWKGSIIGIAAYTRELTPDELFVNERAAHEAAKALLKDTPKITVEAELGAMTPVPEIEKIRPYRSALLAEEYKVVRVVSGRMSAIKPGMKIRIFRYGIKAGEKTAIKNAKIGDKATMLIQPFDPESKFGREFQVDTLDPNITILQFVDVTPDQ